MPSLHDLAIDLINDAKGAKNVAAKLYNLEQVKEIAFHRDTSILSEIAPDIINNFMVERSSVIRKFLVCFAADWLSLDFAAAIPLSLSMFGFLLASESGDGPIRQISTELAKMYDRIVMHITGLPIKARTSGPNVADPKSYWGSLRTIVSRLIDMISSDRSELVRAQSLILAENMILFGLPAEKLSSDPRLAKSRPQSGDSTKGLSAGDIPLHHPFINRNDLEQEAESIFSKMLLWASKGGPQGHPFSPTQMALLGGNIANIASLRPKKSTNAATALLQVLQGKGSMCHLMTKEERDNLARCIQKLLRATYASPDPDGLMGKLRAAMDGLVAMAVVTAEGVLEVSIGVKRPAGEVDDDAEGLESGGPGSLELRASAIAAVDAAENNMKTKEPRIEILLTPAPRVQVPGTTPGVAISVHNISVDTELSGELSAFPDVGSGMRMVTLQAAPAMATSTPALAPTVSGIVSLSGLIIRPTPPVSESYSDLALLSMQRILDSFKDVKNFGSKASVAQVKLSVRMILSMTLLDLAEAKANSKVLLFSSLSPSSSGVLMENVPSDVHLPRCLWVVLSHILNGSLSSQQTLAVKGLSTESVDLITSILTEIYNRNTSGKKKKHNGRSVTVEDTEGSKILEDLYNNACVAVLTRLLQGVESRAAAKDVLLGLPSVPSVCLCVLQLLVHTGTRAIAPAQGQLVFSSDEQAGYSALCHLLWCTVAEDFEVRSRAVALLVGEVVPGEVSVFESVTLFAVHSMLAMVGQNQVMKRMTALAQLQEDHQDKGVDGAIDGGCSHANVEGEGEGGTIEMTGVETLGQQDEGTDTKADEHEVENVEDENAEFTLAMALESFDNGKTFNGTFSESKINSGIFTQVVKQRTEMQAKKSLQLLSQLCICEPSLLSVLFSLYGAAAAANKTLSAEITSSTETDNSTNISGISTNISTDSAAVTVPVAVAVVKPRVGSEFSDICDMIEAELSNIIPVVSKRQDSFSVFAMLTKTDADPYIRPLLEITLEIIHTDYSVAASPALIDAVKVYVESFLFLRSIDGYDIELQHQKDEAENGNENENEKSNLKISTGSTLFQEKKMTATLRVFFPLLGGFGSTELLNLIPKLLKAFSDEPEVLKSAFRRIYAARPPPLSKAALFAALHRIDCDATGLKQKAVLDVISLCLGNKDDFRSDVIREALSDLLLDLVPAQALMRTAILSAQSHGNEMKKFILTEVMPSLIRKKVWVLAPKVWEGVNHAVKIFAEHKNAEPTLRCLLGLPGLQLKSVLKAAPKVKPLLATLLKALSGEEKEESLSGKWAGLVPENNEVDATPVIDAEKAKIIKELSVFA